MSEQELEKLYNEAYKAVYWTALSILKSKEDAEDVVQDTFLTAYDRWDSLSDKTKAVAWVKKIAANKSLNIVTRKRTLNVDDEVLEETEAIGEDFLPESMIESEETRKVIMDIINNSLSEDTAMTLILFYFDEMSIKEIAELLKIPQGTVLSRLNYAKKKIKKEVEKYEKDNKDKLFGVGIPFLTKLFEKEAAQVPFRPMPASLLNLAASSQATTTAVAAATVKKASIAILMRNIAISVASLALLGGVGFFAYKTLIPEKEHTKHSTNTKNTTEESEETTTEKEQTTPSINVLGMTPDMLDLEGGYVRYCTHYTYSDDTETEEHQLYYNADGQMVLECGFNEDGVVIFSDYFIYDKEGRVEREELWDTGTYSSGQYYQYTYGANGIDKIEQGNFNREPEEYREYEYDNLGRVIKVSEIKTVSGNCYWYCDYTYEADGSYKTQATVYCMLHSQMELSEDYSIYNAEGLLLEKFDDFNDSKRIYTYDANGVLLTEELYYGKKLNSTKTYEYDAEGRLIFTKTVSDDGRDLMKDTYTYKDL